MICVLNVKKNNKQKHSLHGRTQTLKGMIENQKLKPLGLICCGRGIYFSIAVILSGASRIGMNLNVGVDGRISSQGLGLPGSRKVIKKPKK